MLAGFIFDLDGVITDTAEFHYLAWKRLAEEAGIPFSQADNEALRGISRRESLLLLLKGARCSEEELLGMMERKNRYYQGYLSGITSEHLLPGARNILTEIHQAGLKTALASASKNAWLVIEHLAIASLFDAISDGYSVELQKPAPDLFLNAASPLGLPPGRCVIVEDAEAGIDTARSGNFYSIGLGPCERVGKADLIFPGLENVHLQDILSLLVER